ncbi:dephospho-CoA kinase [Puniceibacterium sediminis]|uniref:Dephospho-CoA kinase n=1 Tax=Puniceibacterium sediminis TaxID=1608407 RepID=A0A238VRT9_9RHOB|nr:dephospho-CoA kinase [Puniceibacterium sediminis]SNR36956.1 dephospho-CoA kinase [Puniceibacterium sediminis]
MRFKLGLTGSIGMGKSTTAKMFAEQGCALWDADAAVHRLYSAGGAAVLPMQALFPDAVTDDGIDRAMLREIIAEDPDAIRQIEAIVHPLVQQDRQRFIDANPDQIGVFDIPLLFETGGDAAMDAVACVTVSGEIQRQRVLERGTMSVEQFEQILARQMPIAEKLGRSDYRIETDTLEHARAQVQDVLKDIERRLNHA